MRSARTQFAKLVVSKNSQVEPFAVDYAVLTSRYESSATSREYCPSARRIVPKRPKNPGGPAISA